MANYSGSVHIDGIEPVSFKYGSATTQGLPYIAMKLDTANINQVLIAGAGDEQLFIWVTNWQTPVKQNEHIAVKTNGFAMAIAGWNVSVGDKLKLAAGWLFVTASSGNKYVAVAMCAGVANDYIEINLLNGVSIA